jgi:uncharacterized membrane protein
LRRHIPRLRHAALALLLLTVGKVLLYDLSTLYRVASCVALGLLLLAAAFAYQRHRPRPLEDLRAVSPGVR